MAATAASLTASGAEKSGKPWDRLTPPCRSLSRVISRITDSVNAVAFLHPWTLAIKRSPLTYFVFFLLGAGAGRTTFFLVFVDAALTAFFFVVFFGAAL